jgi:hypothetical protein
VLDKDPALDSFWKRAWYLFLVAVMGTAYFIMAVATGIWNWIRGKK